MDGQYKANVDICMNVCFY